MHVDKNIYLKCAPLKVVEDSAAPSIAKGRCKKKRRQATTSKNVFRFSGFMKVLCLLLHVCLTSWVLLRHDIKHYTHPLRGRETDADLRCAVQPILCEVDASSPCVCDRWWQ